MDAAMGGPVRVLVVDDEPAHRMLCASALADEPGLELAGEAPNGARAIELAAQLQPDVVVLDLRMPVMDGFDALPAIRSASPRARVVIWSSADEYMLLRAQGLGAAAWVRKVAPSAALVESIRDVAADRRAAS